MCPSAKDGAYNLRAWHGRRSVGDGGGGTSPSTFQLGWDDIGNAPYNFAENCMCFYLLIYTSLSAYVIDTGS